MRTSANVEPAALERATKGVADLLAGLIGDQLPHLLTSADEPVVGTTHAVLGFRLRADLLDQKLRAALAACWPDDVVIAHASSPASAERPARSA